jgi:hypothetical protein
MKSKTFLLYLLLTTLLPINVAAVYDTLSIDITPTANDVQFCFKPDYSLYGHTYLAAQISNNLFFLSPTTDKGPPNLNPWLPGSEPPIFAEGRSKSVCLGPFPKASLQGLSVYAGVGVTLKDLLKTGNYAKIFDGFPALPQPTKDWTVMVYLVGSNLESGPNHWASKDILEMLRGTQQATTDAVNVVVTTGGSKRYGWNTVKRLFIHNGQQYVLEDLGKQSMATPPTLSDFVQYAQTNFPAQHYALILWDHGGGTGGYGNDQSDAGKNHTMSLTELSQAYQTIRQRADKPLDILVYDACLMSSIEVAEITSTVAKVMAGSAESEPGHGLNYEHLLTTMTNNPPEDGITFGKVAKTGYFQQSQAQKTFNTSQITYSVLDLTQLPQLWETFGQFATELKTVFTDSSFLTTEMLSRGIIRAPGYPVKDTGKLPSLDRGAEDNKNKTFRIDLYNVLQTVSPDEELKQLKSYAEALQTSLQQLVVDYEANDKVKDINPEAGRISLDIGSEKPYLSLLPAAYTQLSEALDLYNRKRKDDTSKPTGEFVCPGGLICADAKWWNLKADEVINIDGYYGQQAEPGVEVYLIKPLYRYQPLAQTLEIGVNGQEACQYQLCVSDTECSNLTVTESQGLWLADVVYNDLPAILTLCQEDNATWKACSVLPQQDSVWGRDGPLAAGDTLTPTVLHLQDGELTQQHSPSLVVGETVPVIKPICDMPKAVITASYFGNNYKPQFERLCDKGDCVCKENDKNESCITTANQFRAGVRIEVR